MAKFWKITGVVVLGLFVVVIGSGAYFLHNFDLNQYKSYVSELVEKQIGRKLEIKGDASIGISLVPTLIVEDVELQNAPWASQPQMVTLQKLELKLAVLPLLKKNIVLDKMILTSPKIYLETSVDGKNNWDFSKNEKVKVEPLPAELPPAMENMQVSAANPAAGLLLGFAARNFEINSGMLEISNLKSGAKNVIDINSVAISAPSADEQINLSFNVDIDGQKVKGKAVLGSLQQLLVEKGAYPVSLDASAYGIDINLDGSLTDIFNNLQFAFNSNIYNPAGNMNAPETTLNALLEGNLQQISAAIKQLNIVNNLITGNIRADISGKVPNVMVNLKSDLINLQNFSSNSNFAISRISLINTAQATELVPAGLIPYSALQTVNAQANVNIGKLVVDAGMTAENVGLKANLNNGILNIDPLTLSFGGGKINVVAQVDAAKQSMRLQASSENLLLQKLHKEFTPQNNKSFGILSGGKTDIVLNLSGSGKTYRQLAENLNGQVIGILEESVVQTGALSFLKGNFISQLLNMINFSSRKNTDVHLKCAVVRTDIKNGLADFPKGIAVQAEEMSLVSTGNLNLKDDVINFSIQPYSGQIKDFNIAQALSSFIKVKGTLQDPKISLDDASALKTLAGVAAAGPAYLGGQVLLDANSSPCYTALEGTPYKSRFPAPSKVQQTKQDIGNHIDSDIKAIKGMAGDIKNNAKNLLRSFK